MASQQQEIKLSEDGRAIAEQQGIGNAIREGFMPPEPSIDTYHLTQDEEVQKILDMPMKDLLMAAPLLPAKFLDSRLVHTGWIDKKQGKIEKLKLKLIFARIKMSFPEDQYTLSLDALIDAGNYYMESVSVDDRVEGRRLKAVTEHRRTVTLAGMAGQQRKKVLGIL